MLKEVFIAVPKTQPPRSIESDLRLISLTPTPVKLLESIVGEWTLEKIEDKLDAYQYGALKGRSTTHALVDLLTLIVLLITYWLANYLAFGLAHI